LELVLIMNSIPSQTDRRNFQADQHVLWAHLNDAQKSAVSSLSGFGYELSFVRISEQESIVVLLLGDKSATIDIEGEINTDPDIHIRSQF
jgi:hypothetical protein